MDYLNLYDKEKLKELLKTNSVGQISKIIGADPRAIRRAMRQYGFDKSPEPEGLDRLCIKDTPLGHIMADALGLEVGVIYPVRNTHGNDEHGNGGCSKGGGVT